MTDDVTDDTAGLRLRLDLPGVAPDAAAELGREIGALDAVQAATAAPTRLGLGGIVMLVQVAAGALGSAGTVVSVVERLVALLRGKGVTGARIELPGGGSVEVDHASVEEIERLVAAVGGGREVGTSAGGSG
jgi:hypothetical protein